MPIDTQPATLLSAEELRIKTEFANAVVWKQADLNVLRPELSGQYAPIALALQEHINECERRHELLLPDFRAFENQTVSAFSDYGGESNDAKYLTYSVLLCARDLTGPFSNFMTSVREKHGLGDKEIAFKDFRMGQIRRALPEYLAALNNLPGLLFTVTVDKRLTDLFGSPDKESRAQLSKVLNDLGLGDRKAAVNEKLLRIVHITAFMTALLAHDGHKIFWMSDHDAISPTLEIHEKTLELFVRVLNHYRREGASFPLIGGALPFSEKNVAMLDLLSATDVVAGSIEHYLTQRDQALPGKLKPGSELVLKWLANDGIGLKKLNMILRPGDNNAILPSTMKFKLTAPPEEATFIPIVV